MPCTVCGESAREKCGGYCFCFRRDDDGTARYICLDCGKKQIEEAAEGNTPPNRRDE